MPGDAFRGAMYGADVCTLLRGDHEKVRRLVDRLEAAGDRQERERVLEAIRREVRIHQELEEKILFPAVKEHMGRRHTEAVRAAREENEATLRTLDDLQDRMDDGGFVEALDVLRARAALHADIEEDDVFRWIQDALDTKTMQLLGQRLNERRLEMEQLYHKNAAETERLASEP